MSHTNRRSALNAAARNQHARRRNDVTLRAPRPPPPSVHHAHLSAHAPAAHAAAADATSVSSAHLSSTRGGVVQTQRTSYYMSASAPTPILIVPPPDSAETPRPSASCRAAAAPPLRLALVAMTKSPMHFETWLEHHHRVLRVHRFYIRVEGSEELRDLLAKPPWDGLVVPTYVPDAERDYFEQMDRQSAHTLEAISRARADGCTHILHVDDDELVYCSAGGDALLDHLQTVPAGKHDLHMKNVEALLPSAACVNYFREARAFRHEPTTYCSYTNGKSFARLDAPGLRSHGPHYFRSDAGVAGTNSPITHHIPPHLAVVLHYESATFERWRSKFVELARRHRRMLDVFAKVPFRFYRESLDVCIELLNAMHGNDPTALHTAELAALAHWSRWKLEPPGLPSLKSGSAPLILRGGITLLDAFAHEQPTPTRHVSARTAPHRALEDRPLASGRPGARRCATRKDGAEDSSSTAPGAART